MVCKALHASIKLTKLQLKGLLIPETTMVYNASIILIKLWVKD